MKSYGLALGLFAASSVVAFGCTSLLGDFTVSATSGPDAATSDAPALPPLDGPGIDGPKLCDGDHYACTTREGKMFCQAPDVTGCASCDDKCKTGALCVARHCVCGPNLTECPLGCTNTTTDPMNCGGCGRICSGPCMDSRCASNAPIVLKVGQGRITSLAVGAVNVYWSMLDLAGGGAVRGVSLTGGGGPQVAPAISPGGVVLAPTIGYWFDQTSPSQYTIQGADLPNGQPLGYVLTSYETGVVRGMSSDAEVKTLYFARQILNANPARFDILDVPTTQGKVTSAVLSSSTGTVGDIIYAAGALYWTAVDGAQSSLTRYDLMGGTTRSVAVPPGPTKLATTPGHVFWLSGINPTGVPSGNASILTVPSGSVFSGGFVQVTTSTLKQPGGLTADAQFVYWTDLSLGTINRVPVGATQATPTVLATGLNGPGVIANDATALYFATVDGTIQKLNK